MFSQCYLAMTGSELSRCESIPAHPVWMACHFSPYGTGLSNCPRQLPKGSLIMVNDRTPVHGHDPAVIVRQLHTTVEQLEPEGIVLDLQRPDIPETAAIVKELEHGLSCPVAVSEAYAHLTEGPVFLSPPPLDVPLSQHIAPWAGRALWMEAALEGLALILTPQGCELQPLSPADLPKPIHTDHQLHCDYHIQCAENAVRFTLMRTPDHLRSLLDEAANLGIQKFIGLHQQLHPYCN